MIIAPRNLDGERIPVELARTDEFTFTLSIGTVTVHLWPEAIADILALLTVYADGTMGQTVHVDKRHRGTRRADPQAPGLVASTGTYDKGDRALSPADRAAKTPVTAAYAPAHPTYRYNANTLTLAVTQDTRTTTATLTRNDAQHLINTAIAEWRDAA